MDKHDLMEYLKEELLTNGADDVVIGLEGGKRTQIKFANNNIVATKTWDALSAGIFSNFQKKIVYTNLEEFNKLAVDNKVKHILSFVKSMSPNDNFRTIAKGPFKYEEIQDGYDDDIDYLSEESIDLVEKGIQGAIDAGASRTSGIFEFASTFSDMLTSKGVECNEKGTEYYFSIRAHVNKDASGYSNQVGRILKDCKPHIAGKEAGEDAVRAKNPESIDAGKYDVIMTPYPFANMLDNFGGATSISSVEGGWSFLAERLGQKILPSTISIYDDGTLSGGLNSSKCDAEGKPRQKTAVVENGELKTYLHNTSTAERYKTKSTSNAGIVSPDPTNVVISKGEYSKEGIFEDFSGLLVTNLWYTRFQNYITGDFSTIPRDAILSFKNGEVVKSVKDIRITDNMLQMFKSIQRLTKERVQQNGWEVETPIVCGNAMFKDVNISRSTQ